MSLTASVLVGLHYEEDQTPSILIYLGNTL